MGRVCDAIRYLQKTGEKRTKPPPPRHQRVFGTRGDGVRAGGGAVAFVDIEAIKKKKKNFRIKKVIIIIIRREKKMIKTTKNPNSPPRNNR